jgi:hypothetical protein
MGWTRRIAVVTCMVIATGSMFTIASLPAGAVKPWASGTVRCGHFGYSSEIPNPMSWYLSGCNHHAVTGGSGTPVQTSQTTDGTTLVISWSAGKTTTIFLSAQTTPASTQGCHFHNWGPHVSQYAYLQPGSVIADTTGFIKTITFAVTLCAQVDNLVPTSDAWNATPFKF